jgi:hypothetical protein
MDETSMVVRADHRRRSRLGWASALFVLLVVALIVGLAIGPASGAAGGCGGG